MTLAFSFIEIYTHADDYDWAKMPDAVAALRKSAQALKPAAAQASTAMRQSVQLPPVKELKLSLNDQEKKKFLELAKYAQKLTDTQIDSGWPTKRHHFQLDGVFFSDGAYSLESFELRRDAFGYGYKFKISVNGSIDRLPSSYDGHRIERDYNLESKDMQAMLSEEIAYWMAYRIPK